MGRCDEHGWLYMSKLKKSQPIESEINHMLYPEQQPTKSPLIIPDISLWDSLSPPEPCAVRKIYKIKKIANYYSNDKWCMLIIFYMVIN